MINPPSDRQSFPEFLRPKKAAEYTGISRRKLYELNECDPRFPRKIVLGSRCVGWRRESLDKWLREAEGGEA
ncbi:AlpA family phage regulatory protein [Halomonas sp. CKK8]|uniref:helix-turn-helix transcriptional regulator n=1 Tax=Halomonas sp. CKK8 TaxID=3036127 RepID=UPI0024152E00|nr:AlpA family phage regulatory protein [Halomonas sp. CKK8]WFM73314.1 AlpA family phage regulatory protein [Halomonas sp. CKK8]